MKAPFQFGSLAEKENFIDRIEDRALLKQLLLSGIHVMLISPRRWGKSSLVKAVGEELKGREQERARVLHRRLQHQYRGRVLPRVCQPSHVMCCIPIQEGDEEMKKFSQVLCPNWSSGTR